MGENAFRGRVHAVMRGGGPAVIGSAKIGGGPGNKNVICPQFLHGHEKGDFSRLPFRRGFRAYRYRCTMRAVFAPFLRFPALAPPAGCTQRGTGPGSCDGLPAGEKGFWPGRAGARDVTGRFPKCLRAHVGKREQCGENRPERAQITRLLLPSGGKTRMAESLKKRILWAGLVRIVLFRTSLWDGVCMCRAGCMTCVIARSEVAKRAGRRSNLTRTTAKRRYSVRFSNPMLAGRSRLWRFSG